MYVNSDHAKSQKRGYNGILVPGDVVVALFPFSNLESEKARPAVVVAVPDGVNVLLAEMTSKRGKDHWAVYVGKEHILQGELSGYPAWIWTSQLFTAARSVIGQKVARIKRIKMDEVRQRIVALATKVNF